MKLLFSLLALGLVGTGIASAEGPSQEITAKSKRAEAQRFAKQLPPTLVVRKAPDGSLAVYHAPSTIPAGVKIGGRPNFEGSFATNEQMATQNATASSWRSGYGGLGAWNFFWNFFNAAAYPTYDYSYPAYNNYSYRYTYSPYYSYYDPYGYQYSYYRWF
jgi:hypothetical protein